MSDPLPAGSSSVPCLGEALVDLICGRHVESLDEADMFVPHFGGVVANVSLLAVRAGVGLDHFRLIAEACERWGACD
jgi:sugar/nucleoside kinase (ribokinase family)